MNLDGLYLYSSDGKFLEQIVQKGPGPGEIINPVYLTRCEDGIWVSSPNKAIKLKGANVFRELKTPGLLIGSTNEAYAFKRISRHEGQTYLFFVNNKNDKRFPMYFLKATSEIKRNGFRFNDYFYAIDHDWFAYGDAINNRSYLTNLASGETVELKPDYRGMTLYNIKEHGTFPSRPSPRVGINFLERFDLFKGTNNRFFFNYKNEKYLMIFWRLMPEKKARVQAFNLKGELIGVQDYEDGPHAADDNGCFLFTKQPLENEQDFLLVKRPMSELMNDFN